MQSVTGAHEKGHPAQREESGREVPSQLGSGEQGLLAWHRAGKENSSLEVRERTAALQSIRDVYSMAEA